MNLNRLNPRKALNKAFLKVKANRNDIELFKTNLISLLDNINEAESEEFHKNLVSTFLNDTYYKSAHFINTKGRNDLVIHNTNSPSGTVGVIIEAKKPTNKTEMLKADNLNAKAFQELVLYYLRERITHKNLEIKYLVATNIYEWFIFDANLFEKEFAQNKTLVKQFTDFEEGRLSGKTTDFFYEHIAKSAIEAIKNEITFTHFDIRDYDKPLRNADKKDDNTLIALYKLLSPEHLLKLPFANDSNSLDKTFYTELLHIIGLTETKEGSKKLIQRKKEGERNAASLIESAIFQLDNLDKVSRLAKPSAFGDTNAERLFNVSLELAITWINRILFLKLLEAQLIKYHKGDKAYAFLNSTKVQSFDDLNNLFFSVLARKPSERNAEVKAAFVNVPYLNSSLFEPTEIEHACLFISQLKDAKLPLLSSTVMKDNGGQKRTGELLTIEYIFEFLNAYDFASEGSEEIQEDNKRLINASVLGLIFEKINGYKDGSFFTPGFITMYMCRETIRRAVVQKFNETKNWNCTDINELYDKINDRTEANTIVNSLKICDPAVGSGHFLVSALNEIIAIKSDLKILTDRNGKRLKEYTVEVENDELIVIDDDGELFEYNPNSKESQRIQETLFHEKQTIIENCLFGVDLNPNSVKICRLRLWIELLKNAYYRTDKASLASADSSIIRSTDKACTDKACLVSTCLVSNELETLPNIDINIKCGNSLISRYALDADIRKALARSKWSIDSYRLAVMSYRNAKSKDEKHEMERLINSIKSDFESEIATNDKRLVRINKTKGDLLALTNQTTMFERTKAEKAAWEKQVKSLTNTITTLETEIEEIRSNSIYENAFEWRFEFPEVLNEEGDFVGFDVIIGNPPYIGGREWNLSKSENDYYLNKYISAEYQFDAYVLFTDLGITISKNIICLITPNTWLNNQKTKKLRENLLNYNIIRITDYSKIKVFEDATVLPIITLIDKAITKNKITEIYAPIEDQFFNLILMSSINNSIWINDNLKIINIDITNIDIEIRNKIEKESVELNELALIKFGIKIYETGKGNPPQLKEFAINKKYESDSKLDDSYLPYLEGKDVYTYHISWKNRWLKYGENLAAPRDSFLFEGERILVRRIIGKRLICSYISERYATSQLLQIVKPFNPKLSKVILGILNSKLIAFYFRKKYNRQDITFPEIRLYELASLPIKLPNDPISMEELINKIILLKEEDNNNDTSAFESEIDHLVYQLYELTDEEIKIVEESLN